MSFDNLPTLAEMQAQRRAMPKSITPKTDRAKASQRDADEDRRALSMWATAVKKRDEWKDRYDGKPVQRGSRPHPRRAEAHHIEPRSNWDTRYDVRNGLCLSLEQHEKVEKNVLRIIGTRFFTLNGKRYIDATYPVKFKKVDA